MLISLEEISYIKFVYKVPGVEEASCVWSNLVDCVRELISYNKSNLTNVFDKIVKVKLSS
jgi:hypothetical protein